MSRSSRRAKRNQVPADVVRHSPIPFDDSTDLPDSQEGISLPASVPLLPALGALPSIASAPRRLPSIVKKRGMGALSPHAKPQRRPVVVDVSTRYGWRRIGFIHTKRLELTSKEYKDRERRKLLFNVLATPFSRRARFCVKRKIRREVIFALRKKKQINQRSPGKGGGYRRTYVSQYAC